MLSETVKNAVEVVKNLVVIAFLVLTTLYVGQKERNGEELRVVVVETRGLLDRLRERLENMQKEHDYQREGLLERLKNLEKRKVGAEQ